MTEQEQKEALDALAKRWEETNHPDDFMALWRAIQAREQGKDEK